MLRSALPLPMLHTAAVSAIPGIVLAADSRFRHQVEPPGIQPIGDWHKKRGWPASFGPEADTG